MATASTVCPTTSVTDSPSKPVNPAVVVQLKKFKKRTLKVVPSDPSLKTPPADKTATPAAATKDSSK